MYEPMPGPTLNIVVAYSVMPIQLELCQAKSILRPPDSNAWYQSRPVTSSGFSCFQVEQSVSLVDIQMGSSAISICSRRCRLRSQQLG